FHVELTTQAGRAEFARVALGGEIELVVTEERIGKPEKHYLSGPRSAGEHLEATVVLARDWPILVLRALDGARAPLVRTQLALELHHRAGFSLDEQARDVTTDAQGRFEVDLAGEYREGEPRWLGVRRGDVGARLELERVFPHGRTELGDVVLADVP